MIAILQPHIPHYRERFFELLNQSLQIELFCFESDKKIASSGFKQAKTKVALIKSFVFAGFLFYSPFPILREKEQLVLMLNITHITTWLLLLTKFIHKRKIILWGHGISVKRYLKEEKKPSQLIKSMIYLADCIWLYTEKEKSIWSTVFPKKQIVALNNTIEADKDFTFPISEENKSKLKKKHNIKHEKCFIFCARFDNPFRRVDLLTSIISQYSEQFGFIIIGEGKSKPNFTSFENVYDFGSVYDAGLKRELFSIADIYLQPAWVGLSIVEAMSFGLPIFTFKRSSNVLQCVEFEYLKDQDNSIVANNIDDLNKKLLEMSDDDIKKLSKKAYYTAHQKLTMNSMVENAYKTLV